MFVTTAEMAKRELAKRETVEKWFSGMRHNTTQFGEIVVTRWEEANTL